LPLLPSTPFWTPCTTVYLLLRGSFLPLPCGGLYYFLVLPACGRRDRAAACLGCSCSMGGDRRCPCCWGMAGCSKRCFIALRVVHPFSRYIPAFPLRPCAACPHHCAPPSASSRFSHYRNLVLPLYLPGRSTGMPLPAYALLSYLCGRRDAWTGFDVLYALRRFVSSAIAFAFAHATQRPSPRTTNAAATLKATRACCAARALPCPPSQR